MAKGKAEAAKKAEEEKQAALAGEKKALEDQRARGGPVLERIRGTPGEALTHDAAERRIEFKEFATIGLKEAATSGVIYYEVEVINAEGIPQIGFAASSFVNVTIDGGTGEGVGDDPLSWGFDGTRNCAWHNGNQPWGVSWSTGDVIGFAANID